MKDVPSWLKRRILAGLGLMGLALLMALPFRAPAEEAAAPAEGAPAEGAPAERGLIVVDPGHGGVDNGASGPSGVPEAGLNLAVSKLVREELEGLGYAVTLTREDENALASGKDADMAARREIMNGPGVLAVVSVHMNKFTDCAVNGPMAFYMEGSAEGEELARLTIESVCAAIGAPKRLANPGDYYVIRESEPPAVLVECGFLSNSSDEALLQQPAHQRKLAEGIAAGVAAYLEGAVPEGLDERPLPLYNRGDEY